jgi:hypothetical protein
MSRTESSGRKRGKNRPQTQLQAKLDKNLHAYATAACAAGVSLLACAAPAAGKVVYTPANSYILPHKMLNLDLNHDGIADFQFSNYLYGSRGFRGELKIAAQSSRNAIWGTGTSASALGAGMKVGANKHFQGAHGRMARLFGSCTAVCSWGSVGPWVDVTRRYLGLKFSINGKLHYGWARLNVTVNLNGVYSVLTGYAYETVPNKSIVTGQTKGDTDASDGGQTAASIEADAPPPAMLGLLARGAGGLDIWRKRQANTTNHAANQGGF